MTLADTARTLRNSAITIEIPGLGPCEIREFSWAETFKVLDILGTMGITDPDVDWAAMGGEDTPGAMDNMRRMFATATVAIQGTHPEATFDQVARLFIPSDPADDLLLSRIYAITSTGKDTTTADEPSQEEAGNDGGAEVEEA
jgi:hypothetical protein